MIVRYCNKGHCVWSFHRTFDCVSCQVTEACKEHVNQKTQEAAGPTVGHRLDRSMVKLSQLWLCEFLFIILHLYSPVFVCLLPRDFHDLVCWGRDSLEAWAENNPVSRLKEPIAHWTDWTTPLFVLRTLHSTPFAKVYAAAARRNNRTTPESKGSVEQHVTAPIFKHVRTNCYLALVQNGIMTEDNDGYATLTYINHLFFINTRRCIFW